VSLRKAIDAKCRDCIYDEAAPGSWRAQVAQCSGLSCPLWPYRSAPRSGPFADPPRDPEGVPQEWLKAGVGSAFSALLRTERQKQVPGTGGQVTPSPEQRLERAGASGKGPEGVVGAGSAP
jgi:hypothetical protein